MIYIIKVTRQVTGNYKAVLNTGAKLYAETLTELYLIINS